MKSYEMRAFPTKFPFNFVVHRIVFTDRTVYVCMGHNGNIKYLLQRDLVPALIKGECLNATAYQDKASGKWNIRLCSEICYYDVKYSGKYSPRNFETVKALNTTFPVALNAAFSAAKRTYAKRRGSKV